MFAFLQLITPVWYYNLPSKQLATVVNDVKNWVDGPSRVKLLDANYSEYESSIMDIVFTAFHAGYIPEKWQEEGPQIEFALNVEDNYYFVRKHFGLYRLIFTLIARLLSFNNPFLELRAFFKTIFLKPKCKVDLKELSFVHPTSEIDDDSSGDGFVSVIIPTLNRHRLLKDVLEDLEHQTYKNFEVLVCDQSDLIPDGYYDHWNLDIKLILQKEKALWLARNRCVKLSKATYLAFTEDDVRLPKNWLSSHISCIQKYNCDISCGVFISDFNRDTFKHFVFRLADQMPTGNALIKRSVFKRTGLFDRQFERQRMGDGEFGLRSLTVGAKLISNPAAHCIDLKAATGGLREFGSWDFLRTGRFLAARPAPSVFYFLRNYFPKSCLVGFLFVHGPFFFIPFKNRKDKIAKVIAILLLPIELPFILIVAAKSWRISSRMIQEGPIIDSVCD